MRMETLPLVVSKSACCLGRPWGILRLLEFSFVDQSHGEGPARHGVSEPIGERQGRASLEHVSHRDAIGQPLIVRRLGRFERNPGLAEELAVSPKAHHHRNLHARTRLLDRWRNPAGPQGRPELHEGIELRSRSWPPRRPKALRSRAQRRRLEHGIGRGSSRRVPEALDGGNAPIIWRRLPPARGSSGRDREPARPS